MFRSRRFWSFYLLALVGSRLWLTFGEGEGLGPLPEGMQRTAVEVAGIERTIAFRDLGPSVDEAVVLLHGSPGSLQDFAALANRLGPTRRVLVPDLLGFGRSSRSVPDHSFVAQADALAQLLDARGVARAHVVGFSWGGGVAIELVRRAPTRIASLVMVSALGVQEHELLGRFELNRLVHGFQHAIVVGLDWLTPHFGVFAASPFGRGFTRSFLDSDQRPLRGALAAFEGPMLVMHGREDFLVPPAAAREHHRIVPQSELVWIEGGHLVLWSAPHRVADTLRDWLERADRGALPARAEATPARLAIAARPFDPGASGPQSGLGWLVFALLVFAASMVSEDLTCAGVGLLAATGQVALLPGIAACGVALVLGDLVLYGMGRALGPPVLARFGRGPGEVGPLGRGLQRSAGVAVLLGRFVPGARLPTYVVAGIVRMSILRFTGWLVLAAAIWAPLLVGATAFGGRLLDLERASPRTALFAGVVLVLGMAIAARLAPRLTSWRGRRHLLSAWRRLCRWEFWPIAAIYAPLVPAVLGMAIRAGSLRAPTLVNPPIAGGGLAGESKAAIDVLLSRMPAHAIPTRVLEPGPDDERRAALRAFLEEHDDGPVVLKPDVGERGRGVTIAHDEARAQAALEANPGRLLVQRFVPGDEFGLFYVRRPDEDRGELFSIARKTPRFVIGNGQDPLERLILTDPICLPMAPRLLEQNADRLAEIPAEGERVQVTEIGTHSLGCRFLEGEDLRSEALEAAVDRVSREAGLDFGRYDVRAADEAALRRGEFRVIEFNGLTGEAAHMYDPRYGLFAGLAILREQWRRAFEIGAAHRAAGRTPLGWAALWRLVRDSRD
ncbi:MAG: alpha/beta fold hydrolase [bacterium]|nr:alpha/beta fold hydrolase [bacterium]